jgi:hypothetical protein
MTLFLQRITNSSDSSSCKNFLKPEGIDEEAFLPSAGNCNSARHQEFYDPVEN